MPFIDPKTGEIVVRVLYDGAPEAGKTTNVRVLSSSLAMQRRGEMVSPGSEGRITEYFDWFDFAGGYLDGRRVRCQLVSVPGQSRFIRRRDHLLRTADAAVFVADSHPLLVEENRDVLELLREIAEEADPAAPIGIVLQANKQDRPNALAPEVLARRLELPPQVPALPAIAERGIGVREAFLFAVRLASERVRSLALKHALPAASDGHDRPEALLSALARLDADQAWVRGTPSMAERTAELDGRPTLEVRVGRPSPVPPELAAPPPIARPEETGADVSGADVRVLVLPDPNLVPAGCNWPPVTARAMLASLHASARRGATERSGWAPPGAIALVSERGLMAHTCEAWARDSLEEARIALLDLVRAWLPLRAYLPRSRSAIAAADGTRFRVWVLTPSLRSMADQIDRALDSMDPDRIGEALIATCEAVLAHQDAEARGITLGSDPATLASEEARLVTLWIPGAPRTGTHEDLLEALRERWSALDPDHEAARKARVETSARARVLARVLSRRAARGASG